MDSSQPLTPLFLVVHNELGEKCLDWNALNEAWRATAEPCFYIGWHKQLRAKKDANASILTTESFVTVSPSDRSPGENYTTTGEGIDEVSNFGDNDVKMEYADRHPGTAMDSDCEEGDDFDAMYPYYNRNETTSPITTTAAKYVFRLAFAGPSTTSKQGSKELEAAYQFQLSARVDESRRCLNLDCFEWNGKPIDLFDETSPPLPTNGDLRKFEDNMLCRQIQKSSFDDSESDSEDEGMYEIVKPREGVDTFSKNAIIEMNYRALVGKFTDSRCLRLRIDLSNNVRGIRLMTGHVHRTAEGDTDIPAVLVLETKGALGDDAFAARKVCSKYSKERAFALVPDWTPGKVASTASRFYIYGTLTELRDTAALIARLCPNLADMLSSRTNASNSLKASVSADYGSAPGFAEQNGDDRKLPSKKNRTSKCMTVDDVHKALVEAKLVSSLAEAQETSQCLRKAVMMGHLELSPSTTTATIIHSASCVHCGNNLECTMGEALHQPEYGGTDYEEGGEDAGVKCKNCGCGNYITRLCQGQFEFDSGKFHNHCTSCPDFGTCIGDYREMHCRFCNEHFFTGLSGFPCPTCGNGKSKPLSEMEPPPAASWGGFDLEAAGEVLEATLARETDPMKRMMLRMAVDPESIIAMNQDPDASPQDLLLSSLAGRHIIANQGTGAVLDMLNNGSDGSGDGEECRLM